VATEETAATVDCLGDSSTFGFGVPAEQTYPARLEGRLRAATGDRTLRVRNFGIPGYTSYEARLLAERDRAHAPVTVVWVGFNDHFPALPTHTRARSLLRRRIAYACFRSRACAYFFDWLTHRDPNAPPVTPPTPDAYYPDVPPDDYVRQLTRTIRALRDAGSEPILLVYPSLSVDAAMRLEIARYWKQPLELVDANLGAHTEYQNLTREVAAREGVRVVDLPPAFDAAGNDALHFDWVHPNAAGQELIARLLEPVVREALAEQAAGSPSNP
jgi:lysophospholipase L1-like esterase